MDQHSADNCQCHKQATTVQQTLSELDFDRGIWNAAIYNEPERVRDFIEKGKCMERDNCNYTALHYAARSGNKEICRILIEEGHADVNAVTKGGVTSLHRAAMMGHLEIVKMLLAAKANPQLQDDDGMTALHRAACRGRVEVCKCLLKNQPSLKMIKDKKDRLPFNYLEDDADEELKKMLQSA